MKIRSLLALDRGRWRHPWFTRARWSATRKQWLAFVNIGLVNAIDPTVSLPRSEWPRGFTLPDATATSADVPLASRPALPLTGFRDAATIDVPEYFLARGVQKPPEIDTSGEGITIQQEGLLEDAARARQLRACDIVLVIDKPSMTTQWTTAPGETGTVAQFSVGIAYAPGHRSRARLVMKTQFTPPVPPSRADLLTGTLATPTIDENLVATVYLLSPRGASPESEPDETWSAHVKHNLFWNVHHGMKQLEPPLAKQNLQLQTGLAGGVGDSINNFILAQINDANSAASEFIGREILDTRIWTA